MLSARFKVAEARPPTAETVKLDFGYRVSKPDGLIWRVLCGDRNCGGQLAVTRLYRRATGKDRRDMWAVLTHHCLVQVEPGRWTVGSYAARKWWRYERRPRVTWEIPAHTRKVRQKHGSRVEGVFPMSQESRLEWALLRDLIWDWSELMSGKKGVALITMLMQAGTVVRSSEALVITCPRCGEEWQVSPDEAGKDGTSSSVA
jgi:hypothetical protein